MKTQYIDSLESLNEVLKRNLCFANGKNFKIEHLYATSANSRWPHENLWGIYLAKPWYTWMAVWMAITSRSLLKKRQIQYVSPKIAEGDHIGHITLYNPENLSIKEMLCNEAYLYLFEIDWENIEILNISHAITAEIKQRVLLKNGFEEKTIFKRKKEYHALVALTKEKLVVNVDEWQIALINIETIVPTTEVILGKEVIEALASRITWSKEEIGENYIVK
ncbi:hypothetical protein HY967_02920 [Candidatus Jorgensenbacteria bacterium]|nr:hypothetical protein [Candidatus Jorgensenbacteria bacterium]